jgi:hypothetical protein
MQGIKLSLTDLNSTLLEKADIHDVSKAVTEVVSSSLNYKDEIEELKKNLH